MFSPERLPPVALSLALAMFISCAPAASPSPGAPAPTKSTAQPAVANPTSKPAVQTPRYGGVFTTAISGNPPSLDAQQESSTNTSMIVSPIYNQLVQANPFAVDKWAPGLAEKWQMSQDGLAWTFDIRQGAKFHDGTALTVDDIVFNLKRLTNPPKDARSQLSYLLKPVVKSIDKAGSQVRMSLSQPFAIMLEVVGHPFSPLYSQKYLEKNGDMKTTAMGTGPFKFKSYTPGVGLEGVKNPDFWAKGKPYLDGYRFLILRDAATRMSAFRTGKLNATGKGTSGLTPLEMEQTRKENPEIKLLLAGTLLGPWFSMNTKKAPLTDVRIRKAINLVVDRQAAIKVLGQGHGVIGKVFPVDPWGIPMDEMLKMPGYRQPKDSDIAEAKKLMQEAGYPDGFEMTILARQMWQSRDSAVFMTNQLGLLGIKARVTPMEDAIFWDTGRKRAQDAMVYTPTWIFGFDPHWEGRFWGPGGTVNYSGNDDDKDLVSLWDEQIKTVDVDKRKVLIRKVEEHLYTTAPGVSIIWLQSYVGVRPEVRNIVYASEYLGNSLEEIWLAQ